MTLTIDVPQWIVETREVDHSDFTIAYEGVVYLVGLGSGEKYEIYVSQPTYPESVAIENALDGFARMLRRVFFREVLNMTPEEVTKDHK